VQLLQNSIQEAQLRQEVMKGFCEIRLEIQVKKSLKNLVELNKLF
jgi:hypothetical protein